MSSGSLFPVGPGRMTPRLVVGFAVKVGAAFVIAPRDNSLEVVAKSASLQIVLDVRDLSRLAAEIDSFSPLPGFNAQEKEHGLDKDNAPFPADASVLKDNRVENRNVDDGKHGDEACDDGPEQELVAPDINDPLRKVALALGLHTEERSAHVDHFPGKEKSEPSEAGERSGTSAENDRAVVGVFVVAVVSNVGGAVAKAVQDKDEGHQAEGGHPEAVNDHVD